MAKIFAFLAVVVEGAASSESTYYRDLSLELDREKRRAATMNSIVGILGPNQQVMFTELQVEAFAKARNPLCSVKL